MADGLIICDDLIFTSRVTATARAHRLTVRSAGSVTAGLQTARANRLTCVILDLNLPGLDLSDLLAGLKAACPTPPRLVGYGSHVDAPALKAARTAGVDLVLTRSQFVDRLDAELPNWINDRDV